MLNKFREEVKNDIQMLRDSINHSISNCLQEHKQQTGEELVNLRMSLQEHKQQTGEELVNLRMSLQGHKTETGEELVNLSMSLQEHKQQTGEELVNLSMSLQEHKQQTGEELVNLSMSLQEHKQQTGEELVNLRMSLQEHKQQTGEELVNLRMSLQEHKQQTGEELVNLRMSLQEHKQQTGEELVNLRMSLQEHKQQTGEELVNLRMSLQEHKEQTGEELVNLRMSLQEHKQQRQTEMVNFQNSLNSTHSKLDTLMTDVECLDTQQTVQLHQNMQDNLTHQLEKIKGDITFIIEQHWCGGTGGWRRVAYLSMTDPHTTCPSGWNMTGYSKRTCGRVSTGGNTCDSATFPVSGGQHSRICGQITAYQWGQPDAFHNTGRSIDEAYACGVSVTHGTPRNHIWTFVAGVAEDALSFGANYACSCDGGSYNNVPQFVGTDYFCESGVKEPYDRSRHRILHTDDTLWDGEDCLPSSTCCSLHNPPYFVKQLPTSTTDDTEARICVDDVIWDANIAVELVELYVQ